jgi:hypothetical protein
MFPRAALVILALFAALIIAILIRAEFVYQQARCAVVCNRGIAQPYEQLLARMRELADAGQTEQLHSLIIRAQERSTDISRVCAEQKEEDLYEAQVRELIK